MTTYADEILDAALQVIRDAVTPVLHACSQEPTSYTEAASTYSLANKTAPTISAQADRTGGGRKIDLATFTDGTVTADGTPTHWAIVDANDSRLLGTVPVTSPQALVTGNPLQMTSVTEVGISDPS